MALLKNWFLIPSQSEPGKMKLGGTVFGSDKLPDGSPVTTSRIAGSRGSDVITESGPVYALGDIAKHQNLDNATAFLAGLPSRDI